MGDLTNCVEAVEEKMLASRWKRLSGALIDSLIAGVLTLPLLFATGVFRMAEQGERPGLGHQVLFFVFGIALFLAVNGMLLARRGQTVGKYVVGTRIVSQAEGQRLPLGTLFVLRYFPLAVIAQVPAVGNLFCLVDVLFIFRPDRRCIHDLLAGTKVVNA